MTDVIVIGAGIVGLGTAWRLARAGLDVVVLERDEPGAGASTAAAGMLAPVAEVTFEETELMKLGRRSMELWPDFVAELEEDSGVDVDYRDEGTLVVAIDRDDLEALERMHRFHRELGLPARMIDGDEAREMEPGLSPTIPGAVFSPYDHQVDPRRVIAALVAALDKHGAQIRSGAEVDAVVVEDARVRGATLVGGELVEAERVVVAAGAWSSKIGGLGADRPRVRPVRGQMLSVELGDPPLIRHTVRAPDAYLVPKSDGRLIVGATMEEMGFDPRLTAGGVFELLRGAWEALPGIYDAPLVDMWTGFRPVSLDNEPIMKRGAADGLYIATGHGRNGILLGPLTAHEMSTLILAEQ